MDSFRVLGSNRAIWLNLTGSGNEASAHVQEISRMTVMFCSFEKAALILRLYGNAKVIHPRDKEWDDLISNFPEYTGARQIFDLNIDLVQTSCGTAVPFYDFKEERNKLLDWAEEKGRDCVEEFWEERNQLTIDGKPTGI